MTKKLFVSALIAVSMIGCKQGLGENCQVDSDCASGACQTSIPRVCVAENGVSDGGGIDVKLPPDAIRPHDAAIDAMNDAMLDASIDASIDSGP